MAMYNQLSSGSSGDEVLKLQKALNAQGAGLSEDGSYGPATQTAVKNYQQANGLPADGIAGDQTLGKLYSANSGSTAGPGGQNASLLSYDPSRDAAYQQALSALQQAQEQLPSYKGTFDQQLQDIYDRIVNREKFSYDLNGDALYQQYKDQYIAQGQMAMQDTMGQAAALTGGYGNSYAQSVGQQTYQGYLRGLNDKVPELYSLALDQYNREGQDMMNQYAMLGDLADDEYGKYQDALNQYWQNVAYQKQLADDAYNQGYTASRDQLADQQWQAAFEYQKQQDALAQENWEKEYNFALQQYMDSQKPKYSGGYSGGSGNGGGSLSSGSLSPAEKKAAAEAANKVKTSNGNKVVSGGNTYNDLLGAVATAKGAAEKADYTTKSATYNDSIAAIDDAYKNGEITKSQADALKGIAKPGTR